MARPIGITIGDPAGIGPELIAEAWRHRADLPPFVVIGPDSAFARLVVRDRPDLIVSSPAVTTQPGMPDGAGAQAAFAALEVSVGLAIAGDLAALVTAPVAKAGLQRVGFVWPGQTEFLAERCGVLEARTAMMLAGPALRTVPMTIHVPLRDVADRLSVDLVIAQAEVTAASLRQDFGIDRPRLVIAGLNPHAGEGGAFGREEIDILAPAVAALRAQGLDVRGPIAADSLFHAAARATYDAALCCTHDQALIPVKALAFDETVNVTLGLPIVRTSPDHGTAFDIAGKGVASAASLMAAIRMAAACVDNRARAG